MPTVVFNGESFNCTKAVKGVDYIDLYDNDTRTVRFGGVVDFSKFSITDGDWVASAGAEEVRADASIADGLLILSIEEEIGTNTLIKFCAPCACSSVTTGVQIKDDIYTVVDATGNVMTGPGGGAWSAGASVTLVINKSTKMAYVQNSAVSDAYTKEQSISAEAKEALHIDAGSVPADAFKNIATRLPRVGDTVRTYRTDLSDNWALCNGDLFDPNEYPELAAITPDVTALYSAPGLVVKRCSFSDYGSSISIMGLTAIGKYLIGLTYSASNDKLYIMYSDDLFMTYQSIELFGSTDTVTGKLFYIKGVWYVLYSRSNRLYIRYCRDEFVTGAWSSEVYLASGCCAAHHMWYNEATQQYVIATAGHGGSSDSAYTYYPYIITSTSDVFSNPIVTKLHDEVSAYDYCLVTDTHYVFIGCRNTELAIVYAPLNVLTGVTYLRIDNIGNSSYTSKSASYTNGKLCIKIAGALRLYHSVGNFDDYTDIPAPDGLSWGTSPIIYARGKYISYGSIGSGSAARLHFVSIDPDSGVFDMVDTISAISAGLGVPRYINAGSFRDVYNDNMLLQLDDGAYRIPLYAIPASSPSPMYEYIKIKEGV